MHFAARTVAGLVLVFFAAGLAAAQGLPAWADLKGPAIALAGKFDEALTNHDADGALALLDDGVTVDEDGPCALSKADYRSECLARDMDFASAFGSRAYIFRDAGQSGNLAWAVTEANAQGVRDGKRVEMFTAETVIARRGPKGWRIIHIHRSSKPGRTFDASAPGR